MSGKQIKFGSYGGIFDIVKTLIIDVGGRLKLICWYRPKRRKRNVHNDTFLKKAISI